jgi:hypothetical protein
MLGVARHPAFGRHGGLVIRGLVDCARYSVATPLHIWLSPARSGGIFVGHLLGLALRWIRQSSAAHSCGRGVDHRPHWARSSLRFAVQCGEAELCVLRRRLQPLSRRAGESFFDTQFNSQGFNDIDHPVAKPAGITRRIVAIGDSFTRASFHGAQLHLAAADRVGRVDRDRQHGRGGHRAAGLPGDSGRGGPAIPARLVLVAYSSATTSNSRAPATNLIRGHARTRDCGAMRTRTAAGGGHGHQHP